MNVKYHSRTNSTGKSKCQCFAKCFGDPSKLDLYLLVF